MVIILCADKDERCSSYSDNTLKLYVLLGTALKHDLTAMTISLPFNLINCIFRDLGRRVTCNHPPL